MRGRPEYAHLAAALRWHADTFGLALRAQAERDVTTFLTAMDHTDQLVDKLIEPASRRVFERDVLLRLAGEPSPVPAELAPSLDALARVLRERAVVEPFLALVREAFAVTEEIRLADSVPAYLDAVWREGRLTPALTLVVLGSVDPRFERFFSRLGDVGNFVDKLVDAASDYERGEIRLRPGPLLYVGLLGWLLWGLCRLLPTHPQPVRLLWWGAAYFAPQRLPALE